MAIAQKALDKELWQAITEAGVGSTTPILQNTGLLVSVQIDIMDITIHRLTDSLRSSKQNQAQGQKMSTLTNSLHQKMKDNQIEALREV